MRKNAVIGGLTLLGIGLVIFLFGSLMTAAGGSTPVSDVVTCSPYAVMGAC